MNKSRLNTITSISFIMAGITFVIGVIMLCPARGYYQTESDFIQAIPFWVLSTGFMISGIGWLVLKELKNRV